MLIDIALDQSRSGIDDVRPVGRIHQVRVETTVAAGDVVRHRHRNPELDAIRLNFLHFHHAVNVVGRRHAASHAIVVVAAVVFQNPQSGKRIGPPQNGGVKIGAAAIGGPPGRPVGVNHIGLAAHPDEVGGIRRVVGESNPQIPVGAAILGERVIDPVLLIRRFNGGQMSAQLGRPQFRPRPIGAAQQIVVMAGGAVQKRTRRDDQVGVRPVGRHPGQPFHQRLRQGCIGRIDPAFDGEPAAGADIQGGGRHQEQIGVGVSVGIGRHEEGPLPDLHIGVGARKLKFRSGILKFEGLPDLSGREVEPPDQLTVVPVVFRIGTVGGVPLPAPPAGNARPAVHEAEAELSSRRHGNQA